MKNKIKKIGLLSLTSLCLFLSSCSSYYSLGNVELSYSDNEDIIESFLKEHDNFAPINLKDLWAKKIDAPYPCASEKYLRMSPLITSTDGFFVCVLERIY